MDNDIKQSIIKQNMQRVVELEAQIHKLVNLFDLGISSIYTVDETVSIATALSDTLSQMDSDLLAIINLISD